MDVRVRVGGGPDIFTVTVALPVTPLKVAEMVVVPTPTAVVMPVELTVATLGALEDH